MLYRFEMDWIGLHGVDCGILDMVVWRNESDRAEQEQENNQ